MGNLIIGFTSVEYGHSIMWVAGIALIHLAVKKQYEPMLLLPIAFGAHIHEFAPADSDGRLHLPLIVPSSGMM